MGLFGYARVEMIKVFPGKTCIQLLSRISLQEFSVFLGGLGGWRWGKVGTLRGEQRQQRITVGRVTLMAQGWVLRETTARWTPCSDNVQELEEQRCHVVNLKLFSVLFWHPSRLLETVNKRTLCVRTHFLWHLREWRQSSWVQLSFVERIQRKYEFWVRGAGRT